MKIEDTPMYDMLYYTDKIRTKVDPETMRLIAMAADTEADRRVRAERARCLAIVERSIPAEYHSVLSRIRDVEGGL